MMKHVMLAILMPAAGLYAHAQTNSAKYELGINAGAFIYQGDLAPSAIGSLKTAKPMAGIYVNRVLDNYFSIRASLALGSLKGDEALYSPTWRQQRAFAFKANVTELSAMAVFDVLGNNGNSPVSRFSPYVFAGVGYAFVNISRDWSRMDTTRFGSNTHSGSGLAKDTLHSLPKGLPVIPLGIGVKYAISPRLALTAELNYRYAFTDYLDGFSQAVNAAHPDSYYSATIGLVYSFGSKNFLRCPVFKK